MKDAHAYAVMPIKDLYRWFAGEAAPTSPVWEALCRWVADTPAVASRLDGLPGRKRQPNLFLAALRHHDAPLEGGPGLVAWLDEHWATIERTILTHATQTNEPGRCAVLAPILAALPQPVVLLEVGASAGLCLLPDRYHYRVDGRVVPGSVADADAPVLECETSGDSPGDPNSLVIADRWGLDAHPLDAADPDQARWLRSLVWPGEEERERRLAQALRVAAAAPPTVEQGLLPDDLTAHLTRVRRRAADLGATPVIQHSATLAYLARSDRDRVVDTIRASGVRWLSFEGPSVVTDLHERAPQEERPHFLAALDGEPVAVSSPHGGWVRWVKDVSSPGGAG